MTITASGGVTNSSQKGFLATGRASGGSATILHWLAVPDKHGKDHLETESRNYQNEERAKNRWSLLHWQYVRRIVEKISRRK
jgi:hypothetical protein